MKRLLFAVLFQCLFIAYGQGQYATVNNQEVNYKFGVNFTARVTKKVNITVHNEEGKQFGSYYDYQDKFKKIVSFKMVIKDASGNLVKKYTKADALDVSFSRSYEVDDSRMFVMEPQYKIYPYTAEIEVTSSYNGYIGFQPWVPQYYFGLAIKSSILSIEAPKEVVINTLTEGEVKTDIGERVNNGMVRRTWSVENLDPVSNAVNYSEFYKNTSKVLISPQNFSYDGKPGSFESWDAFGNWFIDLNLDRNELLDMTKEKLDFLSMSSTDEKELIQWIYEYMQDRTRYVSIQLGIGGFQSLEAKFVDERGYGDCKALTNYMKSMLDYLHIKSNFILVKAGDNAPNIVKSFPSNQFNHVFLGVPMREDTIFLECTSQNQAFNYLGNFTADRDVLWIERDKSKIIRSPKYGFNFNKRFIRGKAEILSDGEIRVFCTTISTGSFYEELKDLAYLGKNQIREKSYENYSYNDFTIVDIKHNKFKSNNPAFKTETTLSIKGLCKKFSSRFLVPVNIMEPIESYVIYDKYKKYAEVKNSIKFQEEIELELPSGYRLDNDPVPLQLVSNFGNYELKFKRVDKRTLLIKRMFKFKKSIYSFEKFDEFDVYLRSIKEVENKVMVLRQTGHE